MFIKFDLKNNFKSIEELIYNGKDMDINSKRIHLTLSLTEKKSEISLIYNFLSTKLRQHKLAPNLIVKIKR